MLGAVTSERLRRAMQAKGESALSLARKSGVDRTVITRLMKGERVPRLEHVTKLAAALMCEPGDLLPSSGSTAEPSQPIPKSTEPTPEAESPSGADGKIADPELASFLQRYADAISPAERRVLIGASSSRTKGTVLTDEFFLDLLRVIRKHELGLRLPEKK